MSIIRHSENVKILETSLRNSNTFRMTNGIANDMDLSPCINSNNEEASYTVTSDSKIYCYCRSVKQIQECNKLCSPCGQTL